MTTQTETAILAGGRFWGMEERLRRYPGVLSTRLLYAGSDVSDASDLDHGTHPDSRPRKELRWLPYIAPLAIIAVSAVCAAFTVSVEPPRQGFAAENDAAIAQLMVAMEKGTRILHSGIDS